MRVVTFNIRYGTAEDGPNRWRLRKPILLETIGTLEPQIMGLQECLSFQSDEIEMAFPHLSYFGLGRYHGVPVERPHEHMSGEHCCVFYDTRRFSLEECGTFWHSDKPDTPGSVSWGNSLPRITTWGIFREAEGKGPFVFFNTHYHWDEPYETKTTELLVAKLREISGDLPLVLTGDFNSTPESSVHQKLTGRGAGELGLRDVWSTLGNPEKDAGSSHEFTGVPQNRIDWILVSDGFVPVSIDRCLLSREGRYPSDHFPITAEVRLS